MIVSSLLDRLLYPTWRDGEDYVSEREPIIIGGSPRSGTTLLRVILDTHSSISCGPESEIFTRRYLPHQNPTFLSTLAKKFDCDRGELGLLSSSARSRAELADDFLSKYCARQGKKRWAEKTPRNIERLPYILKTFPKAKILHVIRDGRDAICSIRTHPKFKLVEGKPVATNIRHPLRRSCKRWSAALRAGLRHRGDPRYLEIRYEEVVGNTEPALRRLLRFLELPWEPSVLNFHIVRSPSRDPVNFPQNERATKPINVHQVGRWRIDLSHSEGVFIENKVGHLLRVLGYTQDAHWVDELPRSS